MMTALLLASLAAGGPKVTESVTVDLPADVFTGMETPLEMVTPGKRSGQRAASRRSC